MVAKSNKLLTSLAGLLVAALLGVVPTVASATAPTAATVDALVDRVGKHSGAYVYDVTAGKMLAAKSAGVKRILASNTKIFTATAALDRYGPDGRFQTTLWTDGTIANGEITGNLYLRGGGDPLFGSTDYVKKNFGSNATVEQLALNVLSAGISRISGRVYADESAFDAKRGTAPYGYSRSWEIGGQLSALIFNKGIDHGKFQKDPPAFAATKMRSALKSAGVVVDGSSGVKQMPVTATRVAFVQSLPMSQIVRQMDKPSNNYLAEMLIKGLAMPLAPDPTTGAAAPPASTSPATTRAGAGAARRYAAGEGSRVKLADGSGLSRSDIAAPREVVDLLTSVSKNDTIFDPFNLSLPIPGVDGTLYKRMKGTQASKRCHAKTGTLSNVSALSGICTTGGDHRVAFSILQNRVYPISAHTIQDRIVTTIARLGG
ncbi:MAG: D-alanyl-D-alanine carboxypeptidase/D-alanyl-D-alanine-endopeptidase [Solirubrobacterales bacterium]